MQEVTITTSDTAIGMRDGALFPVNVHVTLTDSLPDNMSINLCLTEEGLIIDAYTDGELVGTKGMTFDEWHHEVSRDSLFAPRG